MSSQTSVAVLPCESHWTATEETVGIVDAGSTVSFTGLITGAQCGIFTSSTAETWK